LFVAMSFKFIATWVLPLSITTTNFKTKKDNLQFSMSQM
jgi:hypothetical protein